MRRPILILATVALLVVGSAAPASACHVLGHTECDGPPWGPSKGPGKPGAIWLLAVLDGHASDMAKAAIAKNH